MAAVIKKAGIHCEHGECIKKARFNTKGLKLKRFCGTHKIIGMSDLTRALCVDEKCIKIASFNLEGKKPEFCLTHKTPIMIDVAHKKCEELNCKTRASFGLEGKSPKFCVNHKNDDMIDIVSKRCEFDKCKIHALFGLKGESPSFCAKHASKNMTNVMNKRCEFDKCEIIALFNLEGEKLPKFCAKHASENMINIRGKRCEFDKCKFTALFNIEGESPKFCKKHASKNMFDVIHLLCKIDGCNTRPSYGLEINKPIYCKIHKDTTMTDVISKKCLINDCCIYASFNHEGQIGGLYCSKHRLDKMKNVLATRCKTLLCDKQARLSRYEGYCFRCFIYTFPDNPIVKNYKTKEKEVSNFIETNFPNRTWLVDRLVEGGCYNRRPDIFVDLGFQILIIEIDEHMHKRYSEECEKIRIQEIHQSYDFRKMIIIRFNPDDYIDKDNNKIKSPWTINRLNSMLFISKNNKKIWNERLQLLKEIVEFWMNNEIDENLKVIELYYNQN